MKLNVGWLIILCIWLMNLGVDIVRDNHGKIDVILRDVMIIFVVGLIVVGVLTFAK